MLRRSLSLAFLPLAACQPAAPDPRGVARDETLLTVSATGRSETRPDEARFMVGVNTLAPSAGEASRLNNEKMARVTTALTRFGIKPDDLQTTNLTLNRIDYGKDRGRFQASNNLTVRLRDLTKASEAIVATTEAGANPSPAPRCASRMRRRPRSLLMPPPTRPPAPAPTPTPPPPGSRSTASSPSATAASRPAIPSPST